MPTTDTDRTFPVEAGRPQTPAGTNEHDHERSYRRLSKLIQAVDGFFSLILVESNFCGDKRSHVLERLRGNLSESGRALIEIELGSGSKDPQVEIVSAVRGARDHSPVVAVSGLASQQSATRSRHDAYQILNVARDALERETPGPLIVWCTARELNDLREHAPDFFDHFTGIVRFHSLDRAAAPTISETTPDWDQESTESRVSPPRRLISLYEERLTSGSINETERLATMLNLAELLVDLPECEALGHADRIVDLLEEAERLVHEDDRRDRIRIHDCRGAIEQKRMNLALAADHYRQALGLERLSDNDTEQQLRNVAVALVKVGDVEVAEGNRESALARYRESLDIGRRIVERFGESPQSLRELSVALSKVGSVELAVGNRESALARYRESLDICRLIVARFAESTQSLRDLSVSLNKVGSVELAEGIGEAALARYRESLAIRRQLIDRFGEPPQSMHDLSVSLDNVGDMELAEGNWESALARYGESLDICRRIVDRFGESPQSLRDLSVSLNKVGDGELAEGNRESALARYGESLDIRRRIVERFGELPQSIGDVAISLVKMSQVESRSQCEYLLEARECVQTLIDRNWTTAAQEKWSITIAEQIERFGCDGAS